MATLEKIRSRAGLLVGVVGLALFAFIIGDFLNSGSSFFRQSQEKVAVVNGETITIQDYQKRIDEMTEMYKLQSGNSSLSEDISVQIRESVYTTMVRESVLGAEVASLGMRVTPEELFDMVQGEHISPMILQMPMFRDAEGRFSKSSLLQLLKAIDEENIAAAPADQQEQLRSLRTFWLFWEKTVKQQRLEEKYTSLVTKAITANILDARNRIAETSSTADILFTTQPFTSVPDSSVSISSGEVKKRYKQYRERYPQQKAQVIDYIAVDIVPSTEDYEEVRKEIDGIREEFAASEEVADLVNERSDVPYTEVFVALSSFDESVKSYLATAEQGVACEPFFENDAYRMFKLIDTKKGPDSVKVSHILVGGKTEEEVSARADSIREALRQGSDFGVLASSLSQDRQSSEKAGDLGWFTETSALQSLNAEFKDSIFAAKPGEVKSVKSLYGTHLVKVTERTAEVTKYKVADITISVSPSSTTYSNIYNALNRYVAANNRVDSFRTAAAEAGYRLRTDVQVTVSDQTLESIKGTRQVVRWAFEHDKGDISEIFECDNRFIVAAVTASLEEGYRPLDESLSASLRQELILEKKGEQMVKDLESRHLTSLNDYAAVMNQGRIDSAKFVGFNTSRIVGIGSAPKLNALISLSEPGQVSAPVSSAVGVHVFEVVRRNVSEQAEVLDEHQQAVIMNRTNGYRYQYQLIQTLIDKAEVEDSRIRFY
ncbi:MAG: SurA N-terminal domain-containing protein [Tannerellaceae bacterium]|jgi:peptidyl-prolyl cis-trans isomerase D|nr:SurA N-terminal domain-containing protein [Tannerellaceae bacterium]